ncbi:MAG: EamA family transporter [Thermoleophilia bacterium]
MWLLFAVASAATAGLVAVLAKVGLQGVPTSLATAIRTAVVLVLAWLIVFATGTQAELGSLDQRTLNFLIVSGLATGASWLFYFKALQVGRVTPVVAIDRSSLIFTALISIVLFGETQHVWLKLAGLAVIAVGTYVIVWQQRDDEATGASRLWLVWAVLAMGFAVATTLLAKEGLHAVDSSLATAIRTIIVLVMAGVLVGVTGERRAFAVLSRQNWLYLVLSGLATGASWLCFFRALQEGPVSIVLPVDKLSLIFAAVFALLLLRERISRRDALGMAVILIGTIALVLS